MTPCKYSDENYQWTNEDGSLGVGKLVMDCYENVISQYGGTISPRDCLSVARVQIATHPGRELVFIEFGKLSNYPSSPIHQPASKAEAVK